MLTENQLKKLEILIKNCPLPKLKLILEKAKNKWKEKYIPCQKDFGVYPAVAKWESLYENYDCCLLGAAIMNEPRDDWNLSKQIQKKFELTQNEYEQIITAFDNEIGACGPYKDYVQKVRKVLFEDEK